MGQSNLSKRTRATTVIVGLASIAALCVWTLRREGSDLTSVSISDQPTAATGRTVESTVPVSPEIQTTIQHIRAASDPAVIHDLLQELRSRLRGLPRSGASGTIQNLLDSKADAVTRAPFKIGSGGFLMESPSLRVFLLDHLAQVDPAAAAIYAEKILAATDSADEWAVALRNYAKGKQGAEVRSFLEQKLHAMLTHAPWVREPSHGFLESFDVAVHLGGTSLLAPLTELVKRQDNQAVAHAAFLALDRMVIRQPTEALTVLEQQPAMMQGREQTRANYFARADLGDPTQRGIVERYLLSGSRETPELEVFASVFPNANYMISQNLLTSSVTPDGATLLRRDREALRVIGNWLADPRFVPLRPHLARIQARLSDFVRQAEGSR